MLKLVISLVIGYAAGFITAFIILRRVSAERLKRKIGELTMKYNEK